VTATIAPVPDSEIKIEVWLPGEGWNGKLVGVGNGGFSGDIPHFMMGTPLQAGYAVAATNTGHDGGPADASFAVGHPEKLTDYGWRAVHELTVKAKAIISAHYGRGPRLAYWTGCSGGGRQGLKEAQRFPEDYDGIISGALGAAGEYVGCTEATGRDERLLDHFPELSNQVASFEEFPAGTLRELVCGLTTAAVPANRSPRSSRVCGVLILSCPANTNAVGGPGSRQHW
jgi:hypothetical protein